MMATSHEPSVWIGCLSCYNAGALVGSWHPAAEAGDVTPGDLHGITSVLDREGEHEEMWVMDVENFPVPREMDPIEASKWGSLYEEIGDAQWPAFCAWVRSGAYVEDGEGLPSVSDFADRYRGQWPSFREYAFDLLESTGFQRDWPQVAIDYFDIDSWASDIKQGYTIMDASDGGVHLFLNI